MLEDAPTKFQRRIACLPSFLLTVPLIAAAAWFIFRLIDVYENMLPGWVEPVYVLLLFIGFPIWKGFKKNNIRSIRSSRQ